VPDRQISLRQATADDTPALLSLMDSVLEWLVAHGRSDQWGTVPFSQIPGFPKRVTDWVSQGVITLAERNGKCVGFLAAAPLVPPRIPTGLVPEGSMFVHTVMSDRGPRWHWTTGREALNWHASMTSVVTSRWRNTTTIKAKRQFATPCVSIASPRSVPTKAPPNRAPSSTKDHDRRLKWARYLNDPGPRPRGPQITRGHRPRSTLIGPMAK
jgi:hypothetical protein